MSRYAVVGPFSEESLRAVYNGSLVNPQNYGPFPSADEFKAANNIDINMSRMFQIMKEGDATRTFVVYNFACRTVCGAFTPAVQGLSLARRAKNLPGNALGRNRIHPKSVDEQLADIDILSSVAVDRFTLWIRRKKQHEAARRLQFSFRAAQEETRKKSRSKSYMNLRKSRRSKRSKTVSKGPKQRKASGKHKKAKQLTPIKEEPNEGNGE
jgi:hypothetical protein